MALSFCDHPIRLPFFSKQPFICQIHFSRDTLPRQVAPDPCMATLSRCKQFRRRISHPSAQHICKRIWIIINPIAAPASKNSFLLFIIAIATTRIAVIAENCGRPYKDIVLDGNPIPKKNAAFDSDIVTKRDAASINVWSQILHPLPIVTLGRMCAHAHMRVPSPISALSTMAYSCLKIHVYSCLSTIFVHAPIAVSLRLRAFIK